MIWVLCTYYVYLLAVGVKFHGSLRSPAPLLPQLGHTERWWASLKSPAPLLPQDTQRGGEPVWDHLPPYCHRTHREVVSQSEITCPPTVTGHTERWWARYTVEHCLFYEQCMLLISTHALWIFPALNCIHQVYPTPLRSGIATHHPPTASLPVEVMDIAGATGSGKTCLCTVTFFVRVTFPVMCLDTSSVINLIF